MSSTTRSFSLIIDALAIIMYLPKYNYIPNTLYIVLGIYSTSHNIIIYLKKTFRNLNYLIVSLGLQRQPKLLNELDTEFQRVIPPELTTGGPETVTKIVNQVRAFYFQQRPVDMRNIDSLIDVSIFELFLMYLLIYILLFVPF